MHPTTAAAVATSSGRCTLDRDELSTCWLASPRGNLVAEQRRDTQRSEYTVERLCVDVVAPALDARDLAVARACPLGDFLLREPKLRPQVDEHLGDVVSTRELRLRSAIGGAPGASASSAFLSGLADGTGHRLLQSAELIRFDKSGQVEERVGRVVGGASWPAARGGHPPCGIHPCFELGETPLRNGDVRASDRTPVLLQGIEQDEKVLRTLVEDPKKPPPVVAAQLAKLAFDSIAI